MVPLLHHLPPPKDVTPLRIERFSPYFDRPADFGLPEPRPFSSYADVFPSSTVIEKLAYFFDADYQSAMRDTAGAADALRHEVERWRQSWMTGASPPVLAVHAMPADNSYVLVDSRGLPGTEPLVPLTHGQVALLLSSHLRHRDSIVDWALERRLLVAIDALFVPLPVAEPELFLRLQQSEGTTADAAMGHPLVTAHSVEPTHDPRRPSKPS